LSNSLRQGQVEILGTRRQTGFTLIEILVVMVLVALLAGVVAFSIGQGNERRELANEAKRFHAVLRMAADEAIYQNIEIGVGLDEKGYEFLGYDEEERAWTSMPQDFMRARDFPDWVLVEFNREEQAAQLPVKEDNELGEEKRRVPEFVLFSSGESTPFRIQLSVKGDQDYALVISSDGINEIAYEEPGDSDENKRRRL